MLRKILIFSLLSLLMGSCIREDTTDCAGGFRLQFRYTYNKQGQDLLAVRVQDIRVYVFDRSTGILTGIIRLGQQDIARGYVEVDLPEGMYTIMAWGGGGEDLMNGGYLDAEVTDPVSMSYQSAATIGRTTLAGFRMMLACDPFTGGMGSVTPHTVQFDDLFFAIASDIPVVRGTGGTVDLDFIQNTHTLNVTVTGLEYLTGYSLGAGAPLDVFVTGNNGIYHYNNLIEGYAPQVHYQPPYRALSATVMQTDIKVQRLDIGTHAGDPVLLYIRNPLTGRDMIYPLNVIEAILQVEDAQGNPVYRTQEDIDREDEFPITISILSDLSVTVAVNGFEIIDATPDVGRP